MMNRRGWMRLGLACLAAAASGCNGDGPKAPSSVARESPPPAYATVAEAYNNRVSLLSQVYAPATVRLTFSEDGTQRTEQGEGTLQVIRPDHLALSLNKAGKRLFWFGCDADRYWWFDVVDTPVAHVGRHATFDAARLDPRTPGLTIRPLDVIRVLGIVPLPVGANGPGGGQVLGATQWSADGRLVGVTTRTDSGGLQRLWLDPESFEPRKVELFSPDRTVEIIADLNEYAYVRITGASSGPRMASELAVLHVPSGSLIRLNLYDLQDGRRVMKPDAFNFDELVRVFQVESVTDLDSPR
ncbi:MAG: hypothetical protein KF745_02140 [Phycisphaeraceae bacterium]|nr:hypothetical protein [Phycisphaeraceae bacterium]